MQFEIINDEGGEGGDSATIEPWAIALIVVAGVSVVGGAGYFVYRRQTTKKTK